MKKVKKAIYLNIIKETLTLKKKKKQKKVMTKSIQKIKEIKRKRN